MKSLREIFRLTNAEQRVIVVIILTLLAIAIAQKHHESNALKALEESAPSVSAR